MSTSLRSLFRPIQPTVQGEKAPVTYEEVIPHDALDEIVYCYWRLYTQEPLKAKFTYKVVTDGCIDVFFRGDHPEENFVVGFSEEYLEFTLEREFDYYGIRFFPSRFPLLFDVDASTFRNTYRPTSDVALTLAEALMDLPAPIGSLQEIKGQLDTCLIDLLSSSKKSMDPRFEKALFTILADRGMHSMKEVTDIHLSPRQLRRLFNFYVGAPPKKFSRIIRFQGFLDGQKGVDRKGAFYDAGYFDQAHFIKEFKSFYGMTPKRSEK